MSGIAQFQAKETTEIPKEVFNGILNEIKRERITNMAKLTNVKMRKMLRKLGYSKYYPSMYYSIFKKEGLFLAFKSIFNSRKNNSKMKISWILPHSASF